MVAQIDWNYLRKRPTRAMVRLWTYLTLEGRPLTTQGRFINPFVFGGFRLAKKWSPREPVDRPIFVVGLGRSGTTILGVVLSMHKDVVFLNEPKALWHSVIPYDDVIGSYTREPARYRLDERDATPEVIRDANRLFSYSLRMTGRTRVVDKYPEHIFRVPFVLSIFPDARFIFITRDGWNAAASIAAWSDRNRNSIRGERHDWWGADLRKWRIMCEELIQPDPYYASAWEQIRNLEDERHMAIVEWIVTMREGLAAVERYPDAVQAVRYEDLISEPALALQKIESFCGLAPDADFTEYGAHTLASKSKHERFDLPAKLEPLFAETMAQLGYTTS